MSIKSVEQVFGQQEHFSSVASRQAESAAGDRIKYLRIALMVVGVTFIVGIYTLGVVWPSGWVWQAGHSNYLDMILGIYATLGVFLLIASRDPLAHLSLIWFTVWSSVVHAAIMGVQALVNHEHMGHLWGTCQRFLSSQRCWRI